MHLLVIPEHHVDTFRDVGELGAEETHRMLEFIADTARDEAGSRTTRCRSTSARPPARPSSTSTGTSSAASTSTGEPLPDSTEVTEL